MKNRMIIRDDHYPMQTKILSHKKTFLYQDNDIMGSELKKEKKKAVLGFCMEQSVFPFIFQWSGSVTWMSIISLEALEKMPTIVTIQVHFLSFLYLIEM